MAIQLDIVAQTGSTNADLLARLSAGEQIPEGYWLVADRQVGGRGRQGRRWLDANGNFMGSTVVRVAPQDPAPASLSFVSALAAYEALVPRTADPSVLRLKWPNDILLREAKLCGILLERESEYAVIGIGVNLAAAPALEDRETRSLSEVGPAPDRDTFALALADTFRTELERWRQYGLEPTLARWLAAAHPAGTALKVHDARGEPLSGRFAGLEPDGGLRLRLADGTTHVIRAGDVMLEPD